MSESNWSEPGREALVVGVAVERDLPVRDEQRARLQQVALGALRRAIARDDVDDAVRAHDTATAPGVLRGRRLVTALAAVDQTSPSGAVGIAHEEAADERLRNAGGPAPASRRCGRGKHHTRRRVRRIGWRVAYTVVVSPSSRPWRQSR